MSAPPAVTVNPSPAPLLRRPVPAFQHPEPSTAAATTAPVYRSPAFKNRGGHPAGSPLVTAKPTYTSAVMLMLAVPTSVHLMPSAEM